MMHRSPPNLNQEAAVVGWISSTDVMLLTVVMLMGVSVATSREWANSQERLAESQLALTAAETLNTELEQKVATGPSPSDTSALQASLDVAKKHAAEAELRAAANKKALHDAKRELLEEQAKRLRIATLLEAEQATVALQIGELKELREQLATQESGALRAASDLARLQHELEGMTGRIARGSAAYKALKARAAELTAQIAELEAAKAVLSEHRMTAEKRVSDGISKLQSLETQIASLQDEVENARGRLASNQNIKRRLVGLEGQLNKVAIVFDASGSMTTGGRWEEACSVVTTWVEDLEMDECVLIVFNSHVHEFPGDGKLLPVSGEAGADNRKRLAEFLATIKPVGGTRTRAALEAAYRYKAIDTILLFTDGAPNDGISLVGKDPKEVEAIYKLCDQHKSPPINTVGLGNYFDVDLSKFLLQIAERTGGTFLGR
jgi:hypothetical protein